MLQQELMEKPVRIRALENVPSIEAVISRSWSKIAPFWPLKNLIAVNPVSGFETLKFEDALKEADAYFQQREMPEEMQCVNRESIKWLQVFFDQGQSTIQMPLRKEGLLKSTLSLIRFDERLHDNDKQKLHWLTNLPGNPRAVIIESLSYLGIGAAGQEQFLTLLLTTLPGWAAYIQYRTNWADGEDAGCAHTVSQAEYLAFRLVVTCLLWPEAKALLQWHHQALDKADVKNTYQTITRHESNYRKRLLQQLSCAPPPEKSERTDAQLVFCIDVRSEPFRRALEAQGNYETYGFAGFFGLPVSVGNAVTGEAHASCPVLLKPAYHIEEKPNCSHQSCQEGHHRMQGLKQLYQSLKYTFTTPFSLVEAMGLASGLSMAIRSFSPSGADSLAKVLKQSIAPPYALEPDINPIPFAQQVSFAAGALKMIGLTERFAPLVVFCGHGSTTDNNAYATALDCGACGGRHGAPNARILAGILNNEKVRNELREQGIDIPDDTTFLAAAHNTTTDQVELFAQHVHDHLTGKLRALKKDLEAARTENSLWRCREMGLGTTTERARKITASRAKDWAQVRPEWGLARNAAFIAGPRWLTKDTNLEGRVFLHAYEWEKDESGALLATILTAPVVVAQWINAQYLFSTLDNVAFGGGSKITMNIAGKIGVMQGNASDLMHGLPLQSVFKSDKEPYHEPLRLTVVVYAPASRILSIVLEHGILKKLFGNGWIHLVCLDPKTMDKYQFTRDFSWELI